jgi:hypothetical protein
MAGKPALAAGEVDFVIVAPPIREKPLPGTRQGLCDYAASF